MNLVAKLNRFIWRYARVDYYMKLSTLKMECRAGSPKIITPVLCEGRGRIVVGEGVSFGFQADQDFWTTYVFLNPRTPESEIAIGDRCQICNHFTVVVEGPGVEIGSDVLIGSHVSIYDSDFHEIAPDKRVGGCPKMAKVTIGDNVWIGDRVTILKGSRIGKNSVIAAGAVVSGEFPDNVIIGGVPAKIIRHI